VPAVIFDFDGVIADTEPAHFLAFEAVLGARGLRLGRDAYFARYLSYGDADLVRAFMTDAGRSCSETEAEAIVAEKHAAFERRLGAGVSLFPAAPSCIAALGSSLPLAIASGARRVEIEATLDAHGLRPAFSAIVAIEDVARGKPDPEPYLRAAAALGLPAGRCVAIEDSPGGIESALAAGLRVVGVTTSRPAGALSRAHAVVPGLDVIDVAFVRELAGDM
jgi:beta-phosphoglucomutase